MEDRIRDLVDSSVSIDYFEERLSAGWRPVVVEWSRPGAAPERVEPGPGPQVPYGYQVAADGQSLEVNPMELNVLFAVLEEVVRDRRFTQIAAELNRRKLRTRSGTEWTHAAVFELLPTLVDLGPVLTKSEEWVKRRALLQTA